MKVLTHNSALLLGGCILAAGAGWQLTRTTISKHPARSAEERNLLVDNDLNGTLQLAHLYLAALRRDHWDFRKVDDRLRTAPDQAFAQIEGQRIRPTFGIPFAISQVKDIYYGQVAIDSDLYVRRTKHIIPGSEGTTTFEGFFIVGWFDGRVEEVPVDQVRVLKRGNFYWRIYPGMRQYNSKLNLFIDPDGARKPIAPNR